MLGMEGLCYDLEVELRKFEAKVKEYVKNAYDCGYEDGMTDGIKYQEEKGEKKRQKVVEKDIKSVGYEELIKEIKENDDVVFILRGYTR